MSIFGQRLLPPLAVPSTVRAPATHSPSTREHISPKLQANTPSTSGAAREYRGSPLRPLCERKPGRWASGIHAGVDGRRADGLDTQQLPGQTEACEGFDGSAYGQMASW